MSIQVTIFAVIGVIVVLIAIAAWLYDARRNKHVAEDDERLDPPRGRS